MFTQEGVHTSCVNCHTALAALLSLADTNAYVYIRTRRDWWQKVMQPCACVRNAAHNKVGISATALSPGAKAVSNLLRTGICSYEASLAAKDALLPVLALCAMSKPDRHNNIIST